MAAFDTQILLRQCFEWVSRQVVSGLNEGLPQKDRPAPLVGPLLGFNLPDRLKQQPVGRLTASSPEDHREDGCPACDLQAQMADVRGLADGLAESVQPDGSLPHPQAGTLPLIQVTLKQAARQTQLMEQLRPDLAPVCADVRGKIQDCAQSVPLGGEAKGDDARQLAVQVNETWRQAYRLATAYWSEPAPALTLSPVAQWYEQARRENLDTPQAMARLKEIMDADG